MILHWHNWKRHVGEDRGCQPDCEMEEARLRKPLLSSLHPGGAFWREKCQDIDRLLAKILIVYFLIVYLPINVMTSLQTRDTNFATNCICRVPKNKLEEGRIVECVHCGCRGCSGWSSWPMSFSLFALFAADCGIFLPSVMFGQISIS